MHLHWCFYLCGIAQEWVDEEKEICSFNMNGCYCIAFQNVVPLTSVTSSSVRAPFTCTPKSNGAIALFNYASLAHCYLNCISQTWWICAYLLLFVIHLDEHVCEGTIRNFCSFLQWRCLSFFLSFQSLLLFHFVWGIVCHQIGCFFM